MSIEVGGYVIDIGSAITSSEAMGILWISLIITGLLYQAQLRGERDATKRGGDNDGLV